MGEPNTTESPETYALKRDEKGRLVKGTPPGPGRPPGSFSLISILKEQLQEVPEGRQKSYAEELIKAMLHKGIIEKDSGTQRLIMNYIEGLPQQKLDVTSMGHRIKPIYGGLSNNDGDQQDIQPDEED